MDEENFEETYPDEPEQEPVRDWRPIRPGLVVRAKEAARQAREEESRRRITPLGLVFRLLPVWILIGVILFLAPTLPLRAVESVAHWLLPNLPSGSNPQPTAVEPVFIVEGAQAAPLEEDLPPPSWSLDLSPTFTPEVQFWADSIARWSVEYRIKPNLIATLLQIESCGDPEAISDAGAQGLFQVMPIHFTEEENPLIPDTNALRGLSFFSQMYAAANGDIGLTFAAYTGGPYVLEQTPVEWSAETQAIQFWGSGIYEEAELNMTDSPTLQDWLNSGGQSLCDAADQMLPLGP